MAESNVHQSCNTAGLLPSTAMRGILDLDVLCMTEILKFLKPLDLCSLRQSCTQLRDVVDKNLHSVYYIQEKRLDLTTRDVNRILCNFGKYVRHLNVREETRIGQRSSKLLLDLMFKNSGGSLKSLSLNDLQLCEIDMEKFAGIMDNLESLELVSCRGTEKSFNQFLSGNDYPKLTTLKSDYSDNSEMLKMFFMTKRKINKLSVYGISGDLLPLIVKNALDIEALTIHPLDPRNLMSLIQLRKLRRLEISSACNYQENLQDPIIALIRELSVKNSLKILSLISHEFTDEYCDVISNLTNLKDLRLWCRKFHDCDTKSLEMLGQKLSKLESLTLELWSDFPYRNFLESACKSEKFRTIYLKYSTFSNFIQWLAKDFIEGRGHRCFISGDPLCIYVDRPNFYHMKKRLTQGNFESIEECGNIKILRANDDAFKFDF